MKKIITMILLLLTISRVSYGAVSEDMSEYVRKDVFDAKMEALFNRLHGDINALSERMEGNFAKLSGRIDGLDKRMDSLDKRIDDLRNGIYLWLVAIGLVIAWPKLIEKVQSFGKSQPTVTLEDVKRLIEENNAKLQGKPQA